MNLFKVIIASLLLVATLSFAKININTATVKEFTYLKGIGEKKAQAIVKYRKVNGKFKTIADLTKVKGIGEKTVNRLKVDLTLTGKTDVTNLKNAAKPKKSKSKKPSENKNKKKPVKSDKKAKKKTKAKN